METTNPAGLTPSPIALALAKYDETYSLKRLTSRERGGEAGSLPTKFKPLVLEIEPRANVRRLGKTGHSYACFIGSDRLGDTCGCEHAQPAQAWVCLARRLVAREQHA